MVGWALARGGVYTRTRFPVKHELARFAHSLGEVQKRRYTAMRRIVGQASMSAAFWARDRRVRRLEKDGIGATMTPCSGCVR